MTKKERVIKAINFNNPDSIPVWRINKDSEQGDILGYDFRIVKDKYSTAHKSFEVSEWGFVWEKLNDGTMGQPKDAVIKTWDDLKNFVFPTVNATERLKGFKEFDAKAKDHYKLPVSTITGFNTYMFLRGFENAMIDLAEENENALELLDKIFEFERELMILAADVGFDGFHLGDDWGTQSGLFVSPQLWRKIIKPHYVKHAKCAKRLGLHLWFHSCGNIIDIIPDLAELGVDVINISQPNVVDINEVGRLLKGRQCFMTPISYQTVSISGTEEDIENEAKRLYTLLGTKKGGLIGYVEEYSCMGMSERNYQATIRAFSQLNLLKI